MPVWEPHLVTLDDGRLVEYYSSETHKADVGFSATPRLMVHGRTIDGNVAPAPIDPDRAARWARDLGTRGTGARFLLSGSAVLNGGDNTIEIAGGAYALDIDYLEITPE